VVLIVPLSAMGCAQLIRWLAAARASRSIVSVVVLATVVLWSTVANAALAVSSSYLTGPDGGADELVEIQRRGNFWTSSSVQRFATISDFDFTRTDPPAPETIAMLGQCAAVYLSTGEPVDPWIALAYGASDFRQEFAVSPVGRPAFASVLVATFDAVQPQLPADPDHFELRVNTDADGRVSLQLADEFGVVDYPLTVTPGDAFTLTVTSDPVRERMFFDINGSTAHFAHYLTRSLFTDAGQVIDFPDSASDGGLNVEAVPPPTTDCRS